MTKYSIEATKGDAFYLACLANIEKACGPEVIKISGENEKKTDIFRVSFFAQPEQYNRIMKSFQPHDAEKEARKIIAGICYAMGNK